MQISGPGEVVQRAAAVASVAAASALYGEAHGYEAQFDSNHAAVADALIGIGFATGVIAPWRGRGSPGARRAGLAILGLCWGANVVPGARRWSGFGYHLAVLPLLVARLIALLRGGRIGSRS